MGGHLITITSQAEQSFVEKLMRFYGNKNFYWMGSRKNNQNNWYWITKENFNFTNWGKGMPNNADGNETAMFIRRLPAVQGEIFGEWDDLAEDGNYSTWEFYRTKNSGFICEWDS